MLILRAGLQNRPAGVMEAAHLDGPVLGSQGLFLAQLCAASVFVSLPVVAAAFAAQDKLVQGLFLGAVN
ncbi:ABC-type glycerol-3-phosphate transport system permease component [Streptomyces sp. V4I23]|nr:ABC-type glycerol-3-phosphate transport system permease component [Streptomyces sp. V4I23]